MSESSSDNQSLDLSGLDFGPAWARKGAKGSQPAKEYSNHKGANVPSDLRVGANHAKAADLHLEEVVVGTEILNLTIILSLSKMTQESVSLVVFS